MKQMMQVLGIQITDPILVRCDNTSAINISKNMVLHSRTKHISIHYHFFERKSGSRGGKVGIYSHIRASSRYIY